jgi:hypothetical protein
MTATSKGRRAALGIRCHSGWAASILLCEDGDAVAVLDRRRLQLCDSAIDGAKQPFHTAEPLAFADAEAFIARCSAATDVLARAAIDALVRFAASQKLKTHNCGILSASGRKLPSLNEILASHALIHAAEGEFYRDAMARACERAGLKVTRIRERDALRQAADQSGLREGQLKDHLSHFGKQLGPPWTADQKLAALAAWVALG